MQNTVFAQELNLDSLAQQLEFKAKGESSSVLFVHFDKNVYANNDDVWFSAYLLKNGPALKDYHSLFVSLVCNTDSSVIVQRKYVIKEGLSSGYMKLPDSLLSGDYRFEVTTNVLLNGKPEVSFQQPITIRSTTMNPLQASISVFKKYDAATGEGVALLKVLSSDLRFVEGAEVKYQIGNEKYALKKGVAKTSVIGEVMIPYPANKIKSDTSLLLLSVKNKNGKRNIRFSLPVLNKPNYSVKFYPEGGYCIDKIWTSVGFEIKDGEGAGIKTEAGLYEDEVEIGTIETNSLGLGKFELFPDASKKYSIRFKDGDKKDQVYDLPVILKSGLSIRIKNALVNDEAKAQIRGTENVKVFVLVHNTKEIFLTHELRINAFQAVNISLDLKSVPTGLKLLTILDSLGRPLAERTFFAHYNHINQVNMQTDKKEYGTREQISLQLKVSDERDSSLRSVVSLACVQENRLSDKNKQDINSYFHFETTLGSFPQGFVALKFADKAYLETIMLIKGWRRYTWPLTKLKDVDIQTKIGSFIYSGQITRGDKKVKEPISIALFGGMKISFINTDSTGYFTIPPLEMVSTAEKGTLWLSLSKKQVSNLNVTFNDPLDLLKKDLQKQGFTSTVNKSVVLQNKPISITDKSGINLNEVTIKTSVTGIYSNRCGDYVCMYNILNCPNHGGDSHNKLPIKGQSYRIPHGGMMVYAGCNEDQFLNNLLILKGISLPKEFYVPDVTNMNEPINFPTVFWKQHFYLNKDGFTTVNFTTGDLTGRFKIIVQGITEKGVAYGEQDIEVVKNP
ncbi:hypothetical protein [Pedobacter sp. MW01-1-1]|uniref:hypothetical protein n=1 Tax=Pedobacter sp. MW01-1-1 TaxID=3383027 RepID=UPI003FF0923B